MSLKNHRGGRLPILTGFLVQAILLLLAPTLSRAADPAGDVPPRLIFSDAKLSSEFPDNWDIERSFPNGPLFRRTDAGSRASITCQVSNPVDAMHLVTNWTPEQLRNAADAEIKRQSPNARWLHSGERQLAGHNAFEVTWEESSAPPALQHQAVFFFAENRLYALTLHGRADNMLDRVPEFQHWLDTVTMLSEKESGQLDLPARGALWIHQTGGAKILIPDSWLIGTSDDHSVGATIAEGSQHSEFTASVDTARRESTISPGEIEQARSALVSKRFEIKSIGQEPFHGLPSFQIVYEGGRDERTVHGQDVWVATPKGRWLISLEADTRLFRKLASEYSDLLDGISFF